MEAENESGKGFKSKNKAYIIPQIVIIMSNSKDFEVIYLKSTYQDAGNINEFDFRFRMQEFLSSSSRNYKNIEVPYDTKLIFTCIGLCKKNWYICSTQPYTYNEAVMALSILYGKSYGLFIIGEKYFGEAFSYAFICDFENKKETMYDL